MSMHKSLKLKNKLVRRRNVLKREERIQELAKAGKWKEGDPVFGLPKIFIDSSGLVQVIREDKTPREITVAQEEAPESQE